MNISEVILKLEEFKKEHGDLPVCVSGEAEYWGSIEHDVDEYHLIISEHAQPEGPKSGKSVKAVVFQSYI